MGKKWKQWIFQKLLQPVTWKLAGSVILLNIWRYVSIEVQGLFLTLAQGRVHTKIQTRFSQKLLCQIWTNFFYESFQVQENENLMTCRGTMTKMAAMPIYGKNPLNIFFSGTDRPISTKLGM